VTTRRALLRNIVSAGLAMAASINSVRARGVAANYRESRKPLVSRWHAKTGRSQSLVRRDETILRLGGLGDDYPMTWASDDRQLVAVQDGIGWSQAPKGFYNSRLWAIEGGPKEANFQEIASYPDLLPVVNEDIPRYYSYGTIALDGRIYQFLSTLNGKEDRFRRWVGAKLIFSPDNGSAWCNQDGSAPVVWEGWNDRSHKTLVFFEEPQDAFSLLTILQMGRNYEANRDGYVYVYSPNGMTEGTMNQLVMFRVPKSRILHREAYEYFAGYNSTGRARWAAEMHRRAVVCTFPAGWVNSPTKPGEIVVESWLPSIVYNEPLNRYLMANWGVGSTAETGMFGKPSYLGFWMAENPWGPWKQIHEETAWTPQNDPNARCYAPQIAPKWIAPDGKSFWLVWTDYQRRNTPECSTAAEKFERAKTQGQLVRLLPQMRQCSPYYGFNVQRVDLIGA